MEENSFPLRPTNEFSEDLDTEPLLRSIFQELLEKSKYQENVARNLNKNNLECPDIKDSAINALKVAKKNLLNIHEIETVEEKLMWSNAKYLLKKEKFKDNKFEMEKKFLKKKSLFRSIDVKNNKYNLIQKNDLLPHTLKKCIDFTLNSNLHTCNPCTSELNLPIYNKSTGIKNINIGLKNDKIYKVSSKVNTLNRKNPFKLNIGTIIFNNYKLNITHKKKVLIQNITNISQKFIIEELPKYKNFQIHFENDNASFKVPPGMSLELLIKFKTDIFLDIQDSFTIKPTSSDECEKLEIKLASYREAPHLFVYVLSSSQSYINSSLHFDVSRSIALNNTIDCGSIFLGTKKNVYLIIKNCGGPGCFFIMNEENWFQHQALKVNFSGIELDHFILNPVYFEINSNEFIVISLEYCANEKGLNSEKIWILCNNITYEILDLIADGIIFDQYTLKFAENNLFPKDYLLNTLFYNEVIPDYYRDINNYVTDGNNEEEATTIYDEYHLNFNQSLMSTEKIKSSTSLMSFSVQKSMSFTIREYLSNIKMGEEEEMCSHKTKQFVIFFENVYSFKDYVKVISIYNDCPIILESEWKFSYSDLSETTAEFRKLDSKCIKIDNKILIPYKDAEFEIILNADVTNPGFYFVNLNFYVTSVPKTAVNPLDFIILPRENELLDVLVAQIILVCCVTEIIIKILPEVIKINRELCFDETYEHFFKLQLISDEEDVLNGEWAVENTNRLQVEPNKFTTKSYNYIEFKLVVENNSYDDINEVIVLTINNVFKKALTVTGISKKPYFKAEETYYDFGFIEVNNVYSKKVKFYGENIDKLEWVLWEEENEEDFKSNKAELLCTSLDNGDLEFEYKIYALEEINWTMTYVFTSHYDDQVTNTTKFGFKFAITKLSVLLHTQFSNCPIICPDETLLINQPQMFQICFHNVSPINTIFCFEKPMGDQSEDVKITMIPKSGDLPAETNVRVDFEVIPLREGVIKEIIIPCHFRNVNPDLCSEYNPIEAINLSLLCLVENISVHVKIPNYDALNNDNLMKEKIIRWPPNFIKQDSISTLLLEDELKTQNSNNNLLDTINDVEELNQPRHISFEVALDTSLNNSSKFLIDDIAEYLHEIIEATFMEDMAENSMNTFETTLSKDISSLKSYLGEQFEFQENILEFHDVPIRTMVKKTIEIENLTTICENFNITVKNFPPLKIEDSNSDKILYSLKLKSQQNKLERFVGVSGIFINVESQFQTLEPYKSVKVDIYVYGNTWGVYYDELCIKIGDILPLNLNLLIEIQGIPLEFPICKNNIGKNVLRFGTLSFKSDPVSRKVYVHNSSNIPFSIIWHIFMKTQDKNAAPFQILLDVYHPDVEKKLTEQKSFGVLRFLGQKLKVMNNSDIFKLDNCETYLKPRTTSYVEVTFKPTSLMPNNCYKKDLNAYLVGYLYLGEEFREKANFYKRKHGGELKTIKMKLQVTLEVPRMKLELMDAKEELSIVLYAPEIIESTVVEIKKVISLKNFNNCPVCFHMLTEEPLTILKLKTLGSTTNNKSNCLIVGPGESAEAIVFMRITKEEIIKAYNILFAGEKSDKDFQLLKDYNLNNHCLTLDRRLIVNQKGLRNQVIPMQVRIYFPHIEATRVINFGMVYIGNNKKDFCTLKNYTACSVRFQIHCEHEDIVVAPTEGTLGPGQTGRPSFFDVSVIFIPSVYKTYSEEIKITTNVGKLETFVKILGTSTHNERNYVPNSY